MPKLIMMYETANFLNKSYPKKVKELSKKYNIEQKKNYLQLNSKI